MCRYATWLTGALCTYPIGTLVAGHLLQFWTSLQKDVLTFGILTWPIVTVASWGWIIAARKEYWPEFPMWRLMGWLTVCNVTAVLLLPAVAVDWRTILD